ncbi:hypothetical protein D7316_01415 [Gordonia insulae]|uniref:Uncharacterized protein n=1 Tax=Gordonia insulae TaxID=2420509 RepID=A0A3G8JIG6_9ACTN|nr:hypothetical protein D7316_01415 [Gordonia insulae]
MAGKPQPHVASARGRACVLGRHAPGSPQHLEAQRTLRELVLAEHIQKVVDQAPKLTQDQRDRLAELLRPARQDGGGAA